MFRIIIDKEIQGGDRWDWLQMHRWINALKKSEKKKIQILSYLKYLQSTELSSDPD